MEPQTPHPEHAKQKESVLLKMASSESDTDSSEFEFDVTYTGRKNNDQPSDNNSAISRLAVKDQECQIPHQDAAKQKESNLLTMAPSDIDTSREESDSD